MIVDLNSRYSSRFFQIDHYPLAFIVSLSQPECFSQFISQCRRLKLSFYSRGGNRLAVREQHPPSELSCLTRHGRSITGIISKTGIHIHNTIFIESSRKHAETTFPVHVDGKRHRSKMPILSTGTKHSASMPGTIHITTRFIRYRIMFLVGIRSHRMICYVYSVRINIEFRTRRTVLHIVFTIMFCQPGAFDVTAQYCIRMILTKTLPTMFRHIQIEKFFRLPFLCKTVIFIQFHTPDRINIGRSPEHISFPIVINKQIRILQIMQNGRRSFPITGSRIIGIKDAHRT